MRLLELFSGSGRLSAAFRELGWETVTLDSRCDADIVCDILEWDYSGVQPFDHVHMSPPCTEFSQAKTRGVRDIEGATRLCLCALRAARALLVPGGTLSIENPASGKWALHRQPFMESGAAGLLEELHLRRHEITYCSYGEPYRKLTSLWTDVPWTPLPPCRGDHRCPPSRRQGRHPVSAQQGPSGRGSDRCNRTAELSALPHLLCRELALAAHAYQTRVSAGAPSTSMAAELPAQSASRQN